MQQNQQNQQNSDNNNNQKQQPPLNPLNRLKGGGVSALFLVLILGGFLLYYLVGGESNTRTEIPYSLFLDYVNNGQVQSVKIINQQDVEGALKDVTSPDSAFSTKIPYFDATLIELLQQQGVLFSGESSNASPLRIIAGIFPWVIGFFLIWFMYRQIQGSGSRAMAFGKSRARKVEVDKQVVRFADVAGQQEAKYELQEVVDFLKNPDKYFKIGARIPRGILLVGMPGTGKTLLAKACAGEAGVNFFQMSGSDFVEMFVGVGASRVRDLFEQGRKQAPCIIFIDELDAVGRVRGAGYGGGHDEREQTLNQMLVEMDGFNTSDSVIILAATNRPDVLDPALLRPGRFDRQVVIDMPDVDERAAILKLHTSKMKMAKDVDLRKIARSTPGCSGADLHNLVNESALLAARENKKQIRTIDFENARDKILMGMARKSRVMSQNEKERTAYHEVGHALLHYHCKYSDPLHKVTIIPRGRALGLAMSIPEQDVYSRGKNWIVDRIVICYGGYAAEELIYQETTTGAQNDLEQATTLARKMVTQWGMSTLGPIALGNEEEPVFLGKEIVRHTDRSDDTIAKIDKEIAVILDTCLNRARKILANNRQQLELLTTHLLKHETLDDQQIQDILKISPKSSTSAAAKARTATKRKATVNKSQS